MKVHIDVDADGYIASWGTDYTVENMVEVDETELDKIVLEASTFDGKTVTVDATKIAEITATDQVVTPTSEQLMINALGLQVASLQAQLAEKNGDGTNA
jgi:hypothetical protein